MTTTTCAICHRTDPTGAVACAACQAGLHAHLRELRHQMPLLRASLQPGASPRAGSVHGGRATAPLPLREDVLSLLGPAAPAPANVATGDQAGPAPIAGVLRYWACAVADGQKRPRPRTSTVEGYTRYLADRLGWICQQPGVRHFAAALDQLLHQVRAITLTEPRTRPLPAPCLCGAFGLARRDGADHVTCAVCGRWMTLARYEDHATAVLPRLYRTAILIAAHATPPEPTMDTDRATVWAAADGTRWRAYGNDDPAADVELYEVAQDPDTARWHRVSNGAHFSLPRAQFETAYTPVPPEPPRDPRITLVTDLVTQLLTDYEQQAGHPHPATAELNAALDDLATMAAQLRRRGYGAAAQAARTGYQRGRGRRS